ncbi:methyl-accepting chemotaxis protein [Teredinibacter waterburyi]|uniref:methyl-accepting chemotaxis protein n=1 Tax=Teredinibacter waterburyi TaxID=1500538 RepID=UPI001FE6B17C|nr:methyl-accepting chemotaxis protein [Teredinibacter waterburyi]
MIRVEKIQETLAYAVTSAEQEVLSSANKLAQEFRKDISKAKEIDPALDSELNNILSEFETYYSQSYNLSSGMVNDTIDFSTVGASSTRMKQALEILQESLNSFQSTRSQRFDSAFDQTTENAEKLTSLGIAVGTATVALLFFVAIPISSMIKNSIDEVIATLKNIAEDNGDLTLRLKSNNKDEIGELVLWFNTFTEKLQQVILQIVETAPPLASLATDVNSLSSAITQTLGDQNRSVAESKNNVEMMSTSVSSIAMNASEAANAARIADEEAGKGQIIVVNTVKGIQALSTSIAQASDAIAKLEHDTASVNLVLDVIKGIAEQTNLLALNAAIEAARAGEQGRGFAVVADEVRGLASRTQESTAEINTILAQLQSAAQAAVHTMGESTNAVEQSVQEANQAGQSLQTITDTVNTISAMNEQIASATEEQQSISNEMVQEAERIHEQTVSTSKSASQLSGVSERLNSLATNLEHITRQFKV